MQRKRNLVFCHKCGKELPTGAGFCPACGASVVAGAGSSTSVASMAQPQQVGAMAKYATVGDRAVAVIIDTVVLTVATLLLAIPIGTLGVFSVGFLSAFFLGTFTLLWWLGWVLYFSVFEGTSGQTLGKHAVSIKVVDEASEKPVTIERALLRNILRIIDWLPFLYLIGFVLVETQPKKKRLGDMLANTIVVRV